MIPKVPAITSNKGREIPQGLFALQRMEAKRIHDLEVLLNDALKFEKAFEKYRSLCQKITGYYIIDRYPLPAAPMLTKEEVQESVAEAEQFIQRLKGLTK